jgi:hypothetical protein
MIMTMPLMMMLMCRSYELYCLVFLLSLRSHGDDVMMIIMMVMMMMMVVMCRKLYCLVFLLSLRRPAWG